MKTLLKLPFKILALAFVAAFFLLSVAMKFLSWMSGRIFGVISVLLGIGGIYFLFKGDISAGVGVLILAFLLSPFGLPAAAEMIAALLDGVNGSLIGFIAA